MNGDSTYDKNLDRLRTSIENHLNWGSSSEWHSKVFQELSDKIFEESQVLLSAATLKRFFGTVKHDGKPSVATLDTLCQFVGFQNWRDFKIQPTKPKRRKALTLQSKGLYVSLGFVFALVTIIMIANTRPAPPVDLSKVEFSSRTVTDSYPNSVVFDFDLQGIQSDSILIQQYWDDRKTIEIDNDQKQATGIYYFPGFFRAKLLVDGRVIKEHELFLKSSGWLGTIEYEPVPKYFKPMTNSGLIYPNELIDEITQSDEPLTSVYHYINDLGNVSGDNFILKSRLRTDFNEKWAVCQSAQIYIIGTTGAMIIPVAKLGCSSNNYLYINGDSYNGKKHDLSAFSANLEKLTDLELKVQNQELVFLIEEEEVFRQTYKNSMGRFVGVRFKFLGLGTVESYELLDQNNNKINLN